MKQVSVINTAKYLAERHINRAIHEALPGIESEIMGYLTDAVGQSDLDAAASLASLDISDVVATLLDNTSIKQTRDGLDVEVDTQAVIETLEAVAAILASRNVINLDDAMDSFSDSIDTKTIVDIVTDNVKKQL